jgi:hypothetical protein
MVKFKEDLLKAIFDDGDFDEDEVEEITASWEALALSPEKLEQIFSSINTRHLEIIIDDNVQPNGSDNTYTGNCWDCAYEKAKEAFRKENNIAESRPFAEDEQERFEEYWSDNETDFMIKAYEDVGIDDNVEEECLDSAINDVADKEDIHTVIIDYLYKHRGEDFWEKE